MVVSLESSRECSVRSLHQHFEWTLPLRPQLWKDCTALNGAAPALCSSGGQGGKQVAVCPAVAEGLTMDPCVSTGVSQSRSSLKVASDLVSNSNRNSSSLNLTLFLF